MALWCTDDYHELPRLYSLGQHSLCALHLYMADPEGPATTIESSFDLELKAWLCRLCMQALGAECVIMPCNVQV